MSILHINQIKTYLETTYFPYIDLSDLKPNINDSEKSKAKLTRALAAFSIGKYVEETPENICKYITDGAQDNGVDCFYFDNTYNLLYLVQSKWHDDGNGTIDRGDMQKYITGVKDIVNARYERFNSRLQKHKALLDEAIKRPNTQIRLIVSYTGSQDLAIEPARDIKDFLDEINDPTELIKLDVLKQETIHTLIAAGSVSNPINAEIVLENWGLVNEPYFTYYGVVNGDCILDLYKKYNPRIFNPNIRSFLGSSHINKEIINTILQIPEAFFYFNNGITFICDKIEKKLTSGTNRNHGIFECTNIFIINGAQTAGSIYSASTSKSENIEKINVLVRLISLENMPADFDTLITKATNTQNIIDARDFISQDPEQERIKTELAIDNIYYSYKRGDVVQDKTKGFDFEEAAVALGVCSADPNLITRFKREISFLWSDIAKEPYKSFFNSSLNAIVLWNKVRIVRQVEIELNQQSNNYTGRESMFCVHGNRLIEGMAAFLVLKDNHIDSSYIDIDSLETDIKNKTRKAIDLIISNTNTLFPDAYLGYLFKNQSKCINVWDVISKNV